MRIFLGLFGASLGVILAFYFLSPLVGQMVTDTIEVQSPDQAQTMYEIAFGSTILTLMVLGYMVGWLIGWRIDRADDVDAL